MTTAHASIRSAFHELTLTLLGLFEVYGADPALVEHAADEIESILRRHLGAPPYGGAPAPPGAKGKLALERLLDELEAAQASPQPADRPLTKTPGRMALDRRRTPMSTNAWDTASRLADKHANQGGIFIRLAANGDKVVGAFCGEPFAREVVWTGERYETYDPAVHTDKRPSLRVMLNFFVPDEDDMKVIEGGTVWFKDVLKVRDKYGFEKWLFEIERHGDAGDPKTTYSILPEEKIDDAMRARIAEAEPHDLASIGSGDASASADKSAAKPSASGSGGAIDPRVASELVGRLKALPRSDVDAFLAELGVKRVRDLKASDVAAAKKALDRLEAALRASGGDEDDSIDPFA